MATAIELISDIRRQVSALSLTDDSRLSDEHIYFVLNYCNASAQGERIRADYQTFGRIMRTNIDPSLLKEYKIDIVDGEATLPANPISLPFNGGLIHVYSYDKERNTFIGFKPVNVYEARSSNGAHFANRNVIRHGNKLIFSNYGNIDEVTVVMISTDPVLDSDGNPDFDSNYSIPAELTKLVVEMAVKILSTAWRFGEITTNDNKDTPQQ